MHVCVLSQVQFFATPWTAADQAPLSMEFSRQEYWIGLPFPLPGNLPDPRIKSTSPASPSLAGRFSTIAPPGKPRPQSSSLEATTANTFWRLPY